MLGLRYGSVKCGAKQNRAHEIRATKYTEPECMHNLDSALGRSLFNAAECLLPRSAAASGAHAWPSSSSLLTSNNLKSDQLLTTHPSPSTRRAASGRREELEGAGTAQRSCTPYGLSPFRLEPAIGRQLYQSMPERIFIQLMTSDRTLKASREGSK